MTETLQANVFFAIASAGVVVLTILACILLYQCIKIARAIRRIAERVEIGSEVLAGDIENLRDNLNPKRLLSFIMSMVPGMGPRPRRRKQSSED